MISLFFFSSRRRHTRLTCDWSSDVCSSDLCQFAVAHSRKLAAFVAGCASGDLALVRAGFEDLLVEPQRARSEERRVGKECRYRWAAGRLKKKCRTMMLYE